MATDAFLKDHGKELPSFWDPSERSRTILKQLRRLCHLSDCEIGHQRDSESGRQDPIILDDYTRTFIQEGLGALSSFSFPQNGEPHTPQRFPTLTLTLANNGPSVVIRPIALVSSVTRGLTTVFFRACQGFLLLGLALTVIGCFSIVQASPRANSKGALVWLVCEALLAVVRTLVWAANPKWDDPKYPIALEKVKNSEGRTRVGRSSYGLGWMLDSATAEDMHALIIGIDELDSSNCMRLVGYRCVEDAEQVANYLKDTLLVPPCHIVALHNSEATRERIIAELEALSRKASVAQDAPLIIYFATRSFVNPGDKRTYLVPHSPPVSRLQSTSNDSSKGDPEAVLEALAGACISYDSIAEILGRVANGKTDNITVIMDCYGQSGATGDGSTKGAIVRENRSVGRTMPASLGPWSVSVAVSRSRPEVVTSTEIVCRHSSHILIDGTGPSSRGNLTLTLLELLKGSSVLGEMKYKKLVDEINVKMKNTGQEAICTSIYQNHLLFNGLFSRRVPEDGFAMPVITVQYSDL